MKERKDKQNEWPKSGKRLARLDFEEQSKTGEYDPSTTERLLEQLCHSFGTELEQAYVDLYNGAKLVRLSKPVILANQSTGKENLLAMQFTRFSPFSRDRDTIVKIYDMKTPARKREPETVFKELSEKITQRDGRWDNFGEVTKVDFIPNVPLKRWGNAP